MTTAKEKLNSFLKTTAKEVVERYEFIASQTFTAVGEAEKKAKEMGFSIGSMCCDEPIALAKGDLRIAKWYNISMKEWHRIDGLILSDDFRGGDVLLVTFRNKGE